MPRIQLCQLCVRQVIFLHGVWTGVTSNYSLDQADVEDVYGRLLEQRLFTPHQTLVIFCCSSMLVICSPVMNDVRIERNCLHHAKHPVLVAVPALAVDARVLKDKVHPGRVSQRLP